MKYLYKINSSYDGFTPQKIEERLEKDTYLVYNWREYFDDLNKGDIIFTYFTGPGVREGVYLISKISEIKSDKHVIGKVLRHNLQEPLILPEDFKKYSAQILTRPIGSVYVIPPSLDIAFEDIKRKVTISEIEIKAKVNCFTCFKDNTFLCKSCSIFDTNFLIKWDNEVSLKIPKIKEITSPFWIIPRQSHWIKKTITEHPISDMFYSFKSGYEYYSRLFAFGILKAINIHPRFKRVEFNYILGIPLSPDKIKHGEFDRVAKLCKILSQEMNVRYLEDGLLLSESISRRYYKLLGKEKDFSKDYYNYLKLKTPTLNNKTILLIDDVITDGTTLKTTSRRIKDSYPESQIYAATGGVMAKKNNMTVEVVQKFRK